jgi:hypothetical protein
MSARLFTHASMVLGKNQREIADLLGVSLRTSQRMAVGRSSLGVNHLRELAGHVYPHDRELAAELAAAGGATLEWLGLVAPPPPQPPPMPPVQAAPPPPFRPPPEQLIDAVVCAAAEAHDVMPREIRGALLAAFSRARRLGMTVEEASSALRATTPGMTEAKEKAPPPVEASEAGEKKPPQRKKQA